MPYVFVCLLLAGMASAQQLPEFYKTVNRVTWVVDHLDKVRAQWEAMGLKVVEERVNISLTGEFRGKPIEIRAWQITGQFGNLVIDMIQPAEGQSNAYTNFLSAHGDGILSIVHEVPDQRTMDAEIQRMKAKGVRVLQQVKFGNHETITYFDTEPRGKFVLGLIHGRGLLRSTGVSIPAGAKPPVHTVSHFSAMVWDAAPVSAFWESLGFPAFPMSHATPREDSRYKGKPLLLAFDVGFQRHSQFRIEWITPPANPPNIYADFLNKRKREGIQHLGYEVEDLATAVAQYETLGYHVHQSGAWGDVGKPNSGHYAYVDTDSAGGLSIELLRRY
jgi:catechol 2,3-dioxygenase-like lactoylglutathione lyase family enzyme